jgi:hypothetical protein
MQEFHNKFPRIIGPFVAMREKATKGWKKLYTEVKIYNVRGLLLDRAH